MILFKQRITCSSNKECLILKLAMYFCVSIYF
jgi:hypothetical protein